MERKLEVVRERDDPPAGEHQMFEYEAIQYRVRDLHAEAERQRLVRSVVRANRAARGRKDGESEPLAAGQRRWRRAAAH